jgi:Putative Flp pilus-assembly TadE/G-like
VLVKEAEGDSKMRASVIFLSIANHVGRLRADERGAVSVIMGVLMVPLVGALAIGFEVSNWYMTTRGMQNAADAATIAAAINGGSNYDIEAKAVAARYGYVDGANTISVAASNTAACPGGGNNCYSVTISGSVPLLLSRVLGFKGNATLNGAAAMQLSSSAVAKSQPQNLCMLALAGSGAAQGIRTNGAPVANMNGCNVMSNTAAQCNGSNLGAGFGFAHGTSNNCGVTPVSNVPAVRDPYAYLASNIPPLSSSPCLGNYPQETTHGNTVTPPSTLVPGALTLNPLNGVNVTNLTLSGGNNFMCGDQVLTANVTINTLGSPAVLVVENGQLDLNGHTLTTSNGSAVTIVFSGTNGSYVHAPTDNTNGSGGNLNIAAPTSGPWSGVAIYQDPSLTTGVDVSAAGNSPTWNISGLVYMPHASVTFKGAVDKATNGGKSCFVMVADNFQISGTAGISQTDIGQCGQAGLKMPTATASGSIALVQ